MFVELLGFAARVRRQIAAFTEMSDPGRASGRRLHTLKLLDMNQHRVGREAPGVPDRRLRIAIATSGRFHALDLARELDALGHEVRLHSYLPRSRAQRFGLPTRCHVGLLPFAAPAFACERLVKSCRLPLSTVRMMYWSLNQGVISRISPCDVFIFMSGIFIEAPLYARRRFGAKLIIERGSHHILSQRRILAATAGACVPNDYEVERELRGYEIADIISIPSGQVGASFECDRSASAKLIVNPYGVDLQQFPLRSPGRLRRKTVLFVGNWTFRKGVDVLSAAIEQLNDVFLVHIGAIGDAPFPTHPRFTSQGPVPQWKLTHFYSNAHVFVIASREEGLALVQAQALASGLPLVCTDRTGGADLAHSPALAARIRVVPHGRVEELRRAIAEYLDRALSPAGFDPLPESERKLLSWSAYGQRYAKHLSALMAAPARSWSQPQIVEGR